MIEPSPGTACISSAAFLAAHTRLGHAPLVPEIALHLAANARNVFAAAHAAFGDGASQQPYWAFAWPGGQALARHLLDTPQDVAGRRVLDLGCGSGLLAIAAKLAGARAALANDIDPVAVAVTQANAVANGVAVTTSTDDLLGGAADADVILIGDTFYLPELQMRVNAFLEAARRRGATILFADRTTIPRPPLPFTLLAERHVLLHPALQDDHVERVRVWRCGPA